MGRCTKKRCGFCEVRLRNVRSSGMLKAELYMNDVKHSHKYTAVRTIEWVGDIDGYVRLIDQTLLPTQVQYRDCRTVEEVWEAIRVLRVRGAPAIGVAAAMGVVLGMQHSGAGHRDAYAHRLREVTAYLRTSRPTAVNLFWALERMERSAKVLLELRPPEEMTRGLLQEALAIEDEDRRMCRAIGLHGAGLIGEGRGVLTHCNASGLALGCTAARRDVAAAEQDVFRVFADGPEGSYCKRPADRGNLQQRGMTSLICDNMAAQVMKNVSTGHRWGGPIAANGMRKSAPRRGRIIADSVLVAARRALRPQSHRRRYPHEQRDAREITHGFGRQTARIGQGLQSADVRVILRDHH